MKKVDVINTKNQKVLSKSILTIFNLENKNKFFNVYLIFK